MTIRKNPKAQNGDNIRYTKVGWVLRSTFIRGTRWPRAKDFFFLFHGTLNCTVQFVLHPVLTCILQADTRTLPMKRGQPR